MKARSILVTGASGELGSSLIEILGESQGTRIVATDLAAPKRTLGGAEFIKGDLRDESLLSSLFQKGPFDLILHNAALLSTSAERSPELAQEVNVSASAKLMALTRKQIETTGTKATFVFPSSIAAYGLRGSKKEYETQHVNEEQYLDPITIYGINKLYVERLGDYYRNFYKLAEELDNRALFDFRSLRFAGILSSDTEPTGGTTDYASGMFHAACRGENYECFVKPETTLPFLTMPDAVSAILGLIEAPQENLTRTSYNVTGFSVSAQELTDLVSSQFKSIKISFNVTPFRQKIVDSWPRYVDDSAARRDWGWQPKYNKESAFKEYLIPQLALRYAA